MKKNKTLKSLREILSKHSGRDRSGQVAMRHQGGRQKRYYRLLDFRRGKDGILAKVVGLEYDPNRNVDIALIQYQDGEKSYILAPLGLKVGARVSSGTEIEANLGNTLPLGSIPVGSLVHNIEIKPGKGGQIVRSAGTVATVLSKEGNLVQLKLPSGEIRVFKAQCRASLGQLSHPDWKNLIVGKAGRNRHLGIRPTVRGVAQNPRSHPHGGGEGRSGIGMSSPKSPWGKRTLGKKTRKHAKYSDRFIIQRRGK